MSKLKQIIQEEVDKQCEKFNLNPNELKGVLQELFTFNSSQLLRNIGSQDEILDDRELLPIEFWEQLLDTINESYNDSTKEWDEELKERKYQILCWKYFTKQDFESIEDIEANLRLNIKRYFSSLQNYTSLEDFRERFFNLPSDVLLNFVRYILNNSKELNKKLILTKEELKSKIDELKEERLKTIDKISFVSNRNATTFDIQKLKKLIDFGLFYEDNLLNRGVNEYIYKLLSHRNALEALKDTFNSTFVDDLKRSAESSTAYMAHISSIKDEESAEYFSPSGVQQGRRFDNEIEAVKNKDFGDAIIDTDSIFKEPKSRLQKVSWDDSNSESEPTEGGDENNDGGDDFGGGFSGGGGGSFGSGGSYSGPTGGDETVDIDDAEVGTNVDSEAGEGSEEEGMPAGDDGFPVDFGTPESNDTTTEEEPEEEKK